MSQNILDNNATNNDIVESKSGFKYPKTSKSGKLPTGSTGSTAKARLRDKGRKRGQKPKQLTELVFKLNAYELLIQITSLRMPNAEHEFDAGGFHETISVMNQMMQYTKIAQSCRSSTPENIDEYTYRLGHVLKAKKFSYTLKSINLLGFMIETK
jgi:hypothetical protein